MSVPAIPPTRCIRFLYRHSRVGAPGPSDREYPGRMTRLDGAEVSEVSSDTGLRFVGAMAAKDRAGLRELLDRHVDFRGLTPSRSWEASTPDGVAEIAFGSWFEPQDHILETLEARADQVEGRGRLHYRFRVESGGETFLVEQHGYYDTADGRITRMSLMCAGFRPLAP